MVCRPVSLCRPVLKNNAEEILLSVYLLGLFWFYLEKLAGKGQYTPYFLIDKYFFKIDEPTLVLTYFAGVSKIFFLTLI